MIAPEPAQNREPLYDVDAVAGTRQSTARLLGGFIYRERKARGISAEVFIEPIERSPAWLMAVERGEVLLTPPMVTNLEWCFVASDGSIRPEEEKVVDVRAALTTLESEPYGSLARDLRTHFQFDVEFDGLPDSGAPIGEGPVPIVTSIRQQDRLLILAPILLVSAVALCGVQILRWSLGHDVAFDLSLPLLVTGGVLAFAALFLGPLDRWLSLLAEKDRSSTMKARNELYHTTRRVNGLATPAHEDAHQWFTPTDEPHLMSGAREPSRRNGLLADFSERLSALLAVVAILAVLALVAPLIDEGIAPRDLGLVPFVLVTASIALAIRASAAEASTRVLHALARGCGLTLPRVERLTLDP